MTRNIGRLTRANARARLRALADAGALKWLSAAKTEALMLTAGIPRIAGGDGSALGVKLANADDTIRGLEQDAATKWSSYEAAKTAFVSSDEDPTTGGPLFKAMEAASKDHDGLADKLADAKSAREALARLDAFENGRKSAPGGGGGTAQQHGGLAPELRALLAGMEQRASAGDRVVDSDEFKAAVASGVFESAGDLGRVALGKAWDRGELKALIGSGATGAGPFITPQNVGYYASPTRPLTVAELVTVGTTDSNLVQYVKQVLKTQNVGVQVNEGDAKPESAYTFELIDEAVKTLAHWVPAAKQALADAGQLRTIIDGALRDGLAQYLENEMITGPGTGGRFEGILTTDGVAAPIVNGMNGVPLLDRVHKGITAVRLAGLEPGAVGFHPQTWEKIRLQRTEEGGPNTGEYIMGSPITSGVGVTVWGLQPAISTAFPVDTALVGDYRAATLWMREGASVIASDSHADFFVKNLVALLAEFRAAFGVPRPDAFANVNLGVIPA